MTAIYNNTCNYLQQSLETYCKSVPLDVVRGIIKSFVYSSSLSAILSNGNIKSTLAGGSLGALAVVIDAAFLTGVKIITEYACNHFDKTIPQGPSNTETHLAFMLGWGSALYLVNVITGRITNGCFLATIPFRLWDIRSNHAATPLMGIVVC